MFWPLANPVAAAAAAACAMGLGKDEEGVGRRVWGGRQGKAGAVAAALGPEPGLQPGLHTAAGYPAPHCIRFQDERLFVPPI